MSNGAQYLKTAGEGAVKQWWGIYYGYIAVNADPLAQGRVKLRVPQVFGNATSGWAAPMVPLSYVPPVSTAVTVMFVGGDPTQPVWFGNFPVPPAPDSIIFSPTAPLGPIVGEVWVNSTNGLMSEWNGVSWVAYQIGTGAIAPGTAFSAPNITGGTITGSVFKGGQFIGTGTVGEGLYFYNGTPSSTNPPFFELFNQDYTTTDAWGNNLVPNWDGPDSGGPIAVWRNNAVGGGTIAISAGSVAADNQYIAMSTGSVLSALPALIEVNQTGTSLANQGYLYVSSPGAAGSTQQGDVSFIRLFGGSYDGTQAPYILVGAAGQNLSTLTPVNYAPMYATNPASGAKETWHPMTLTAGWTVGTGGVARYKLNVDNTVSVHCTNLLPGTLTDATSIWTQPTGYVATSTATQNFPVSIASTSTWTSSPSVAVRAGTLTVQSLPSTTTGISFVIRYALD